MEEAAINLFTYIYQTASNQALSFLLNIHLALVSIFFLSLLVLRSLSQALSFFIKILHLIQQSAN